jgi:hypothetical protein
VSEHELDDLDVGACRNSEARGRVPQVVRRQRLQAGTLDCRIEDVMTEVRVPELFSGLGRKHESTLGAIGDDIPQCRDEEAGERDRSCAVILGCVRLEPTSDLDDVGADVDAPPAEIEVTNAQGRHLTEPQAGVGEEIMVEGP